MKKFRTKEINAQEKGKSHWWKTLAIGRLATFEEEYADHSKGILSEIWQTWGTRSEGENELELT